MFQHILYGIVSPGCCVGISTYGQDIYEGVILQAFLVMKHLTIYNTGSGGAALTLMKWHKMKSQIYVQFL